VISLICVFVYFTEGKSFVKKMLYVDCNVINCMFVSITVANILCNLILSVFYLTVFCFC